MIKRSHVRQFLAVIDAGSFTQAAARLRVTQPTLSIGIAELERLTGAQLIVRDRRHLRLTEAGGRFLPIARSLEQSFREADSFGKNDRSEWPALKLGAIKTVPALALQEMIRTISQHYSIEMIEGTDSELRSHLSDGRINMMIGLLKGGDKSNETIELIDEPYTMVTSHGHRFSRRQAVEPEELASEVMIARRSCEILDETSRFFTKHQVRPRFALRSENDSRCLQMVAAGLGITNAPRSLIIEGTVALDVVGYNFRRKVGLRLGEFWRSEAVECVREAAEAFRNRV
jgi:DNA-binding transcriptional LysR family regulator